jgi:hypothetical protein
MGTHGSPPTRVPKVLVKWTRPTKLSSAPWCRSRLQRSSSARSGSWTISCSCDDHLHLHYFLSSRWSTRNWSRCRSLQPSLGPCLGSPSSLIAARPCTCSDACSCGHASTGTCHPSLTCACSHPCSRPSPGSRRQSVPACRTKSMFLCSS